MFTSACTCTARGSSTAGRGVSRWWWCVICGGSPGASGVQPDWCLESGGAVVHSDGPAGAGQGAPGAELLAQPHPLPNRRRGGQGDPLQQFRRRPAALPGRQPGGVQVRPGPVGDFRGRGDPERVNQPPHPLRDTGRPEQVRIGQPPDRAGTSDRASPAAARHSAQPGRRSAGLSSNSAGELISFASTVTRPTPLLSLSRLYGTPPTFQRRRPTRGAKLWKLRHRDRLLGDPKPRRHPQHSVIAFKYAAPRNTAQRIQLEAALA
ncbi:MAG: hypothetical protein JWM23_1137 [Microbacteriaceae bacterium]|nr:hypothetical protein [Microbacteriaceae bacterium]